MGTITILKRGEVFSTVTEQDGIYTPHYEVQGLAGAVFGVYAVEDTYTLDGTKRYSAGDKVATLTTAADGTAISEPLFLGKFELREEKAPYGMVLLKEPVQTELTYAGEQVKITTVSETAVNERQKVVISLLKSWNPTIPTVSDSVRNTKHPLRTVCRRAPDRCGRHGNPAGRTA